MNDFNLQNAREIAYNATEDTYGITLSTLIYRFIPESVKSKLFTDELVEGDTRITKEMILPQLADLIERIIPRDEFMKRIQDEVNDGDLELEEIFRLLTLEGVVEASEDTRVNLIAEAETQEEIDNNVKDLTDMLGKDKIPNIIQTIADTVAKEIKKSNKELKDIEESEVNLVLTTSDSSIIDGNDDPYNIAGGVTDDSDTDPSTTEDDSNDGNQDDSENAGSKNQDETEEESQEPTPEAIAGENGEMYSEEFQLKYAEELNSNIVYRVKNTVSKAFYKLTEDEHFTENPYFSTQMLALSYCSILFILMLDELDIMDKDESLARFDSMMGGDINED